MEVQAPRGRCWYCAHGALRVGDPPEHVISAALGARLTTDKVCASCNARAGREIDYPFLGDWFVASERALYGINDPRRGGRRRPPRAALQEGRLPDGTPVDLQTQDGPWEARIRSRIEYNGDEVRIVAADRAEYDRLLERVRKRVEADGRTFQDPGEPQELDAGSHVEMRTQIDGRVWLRSAAKTTLAALSLVLSEDWLDTHHATLLRSWLWDLDPRNARGEIALGFPMEPAELERHAARPPEHLIILTPSAGGALGVSMAFFGRNFIRSRVALDGHPPPDPGAWRLPVAGAPRWVPWDELLLDATIAYIANEQHEDEDSEARDAPASER